MATKLKDFEVDGRTIPVFVLESGAFCTYTTGTPEYGEPDLAAPTLRALEDKIRTQVRSAGRLAIPVTLIEDDPYHRNATLTIEAVTLTGVHTGNRNILYKDAAGTWGRSQQAGWHGTFYGALTEAEIAEARTLFEAQIAATAAWQAWKAARRVNAKQLIEEAQVAAAAPPTPKKARKV